MIPAAATAAPPVKTSDKWAVLIGVNQYAGRTADLGGSVGDVQDLQAFLIRNGWAADHIWVLTDEAATLGGIRDAFSWLSQVTGPNSHSVVSFSGHVRALGRDRDKDKEKVDEFLVTTEGKLMSDREFTQWMSSVDGWLWANVTGCHSGGMDDGFTTAKKVFSASSQESEKSYDNPTAGNSVFGMLMFDQALHDGYADYNGDRRVSLQEAFHYAHVGAPEITYDQRKGPQHPAIWGGDNTEWFFSPPPPPPPPKKQSQSQPQEPPQEDPEPMCLICL